MAKLVGVFGMSHSMYPIVPVDRWPTFYDLRRTPREGLPADSAEESALKVQRVHGALKILHDQVAELKPDVMVVFGDDQLECFNYNNMPAFAVYMGKTFSGYGTKTFLDRAKQSAPFAHPQDVMPGHPEFAKGLVEGLLRRGFDPAYCMDMPNVEGGMGHAFLRPAEWLGEFKLPTVPILVNCFFPPQPTAMRCYQLGRAVREVIDAYPGDLRVIVVGSGGLWHTPGMDKPYIDAEFDGQMLGRLKLGEARAMAEYFDNYKVPEGDVSQDTSKPARFSNGVQGYGGPQGGTREHSNWIAAAAACEGRPWTVLDYVPIYRSPIAVAFAYAQLD